MAKKPDESIAEEENRKAEDTPEETPEQTPEEDPVDQVTSDKKT